MADVTGGTPPTNASPFAVPTDIADVYTHFGDTSYFKVATIAALPSSGNWVGRRLWCDENLSLYACTALPGTWAIVGADQGAWTTYTPSWTGTTTNPAVSATVGRYKRVGKTCHARGSLTMGASAGSGRFAISLPFAAHASGRQAASVWVNISGVGFDAGVGMIQASASTIDYVVLATAGGPMANNIPSWTTGSELAFSATYETV